MTVLGMLSIDDGRRSKDAWFSSPMSTKSSLNIVVDTPTICTAILGVMAWIFIKMTKQIKRVGKVEILAALCIFGMVVYALRMPGLPSLRVCVQPRHDAINSGEEQANDYVRHNSPLSTSTRLTNLSGSVTAHVREHYAICMQSGRLGNNMFTFASVYGIAKRNNLIVAIDIGNELLKHFKLDAKSVQINQMQGYTEIVEKRSCDFDPEVITFQKDKDVFIQRYLQSWKYFFHIEDLIHAQFDFSNGVKMTADQIISKIRKEQSYKVNASVTIVGIHYRHGDFSQTKTKEFGYQTAPVEYITRAMKYFRLFHDHVIFVVASNSIPYVKELLKDKGVVFLDEHSAIVDMAILARCDHLIITVGSFGWWAGYLNKGTVLYYKYPAREGSMLRTEYGKTYSNYFYPTWVGMA